MAEFYDEVVFTDPYEEFYSTLMQGQKLLPQRKHEHQEHFSTFSDGDTLQRLAAAREWVHNELRGGALLLVCMRVCGESMGVMVVASGVHPRMIVSWALLKRNVA